MSYTYTQTSF